MESQSQSRAVWSELPQELLYMIANTNTGIVNTFRSVCKSWRSSCPRLTQDSLLCPMLHVLIPRPRSPLTSCHAGDVFLLSVTVVYALHRPSGCSKFSLDIWVLFLDEFTPGKVRHRGPFLCESYNPPLNFPELIDLVGFSAVELGRFYSFSYSYDRDHEGCLFPKPRYCSENVGKVVLCPDGLTVLALYDDGILRMIRLVQDGGVGEWEVVHDGQGFRLDDIVEFKGRVLGIDQRGRVYEIDFHFTNKIPMVPPINHGSGKRKRLVESLGLLYLVVRCNGRAHNEQSEAKVHELNEERKEAKLKVYELNERRREWVEINSIDDRSFFIGVDFSFWTSARELGASEKNCVLFKKGSFPSYDTGYDEDTMFMFLNNGLHVEVCHLHDAAHFSAIGSHSGYLNSLWPPPPWFWSVDGSKRLEILGATLDVLLNMIPEKFKTNEKEQDMEAAGDSPNGLWQSGSGFVIRALELRKEVINF